MCGIAGIILQEPGDIGRLLVNMLDGCQHRGPDSTGFAIYQTPKDHLLILRIYLGCSEDSPKVKAIEDTVLGIIVKFGAKVLNKKFEQEHFRVEIDYNKDVKALCYAIENDAGIEILSIGNSLEIIKGIGSANDVEHAFKVSRYHGTHGIGHVRLATESMVDVSRSHPFWAYGFNDVAIVHNGQITNYYKMKRRMIKYGYQFRTDNDSELIAVYLAHNLAFGKRLEEVLERSIYELDGTFSFLVSTSKGIGFAKDRLGAKPMVVMEKNGIIAVASEEVSLQRLFPGEQLSTYEPFPGTFKTWYTSTVVKKV